MKANYTQSAKERCFSLIDTDIDNIWADIESMPEDADSEKWERKLNAIASEYVLSSRFALMRIFQRQVVSASEIEQDSSTGFDVEFNDGSTGTFKDISIEHAANMEQGELDLYEKLMKDRASNQQGYDPESDLKLIQKALQNHQSKKTLLTKEEALHLGHIIGLTLNEMEWFLLRVFNVDGGFRYNASDDLIDAYVFFRSENGKTGLSPEQLKEDYHKRYSAVEKTPHDDSVDWTRDNGSSLYECVRKWSSDDCDKKFMEWMGERAEHLDNPSQNAMLIYRRLAVFAYNLIQSEECAHLDYPDVDYVRKTSNGVYETDYVRRLRDIRTKGDIGILYENGEISEKMCQTIADKLMTRNMFLSSVNPHPDITKNWRDISVSKEGKISTNDLNKTRTRVKDILFGRAFEALKDQDGKIQRDKNGKKVMLEVPLSPIEKNDILYLIWFVTCLCWGYGSDCPDVNTRLNDFIDVCESTLDDAGLPGFYPPHIMEQSMLLSVVYAYGCGQWEKEEPLIIYNEICNALVKKRARHKNIKKADTV